MVFCFGSLSNQYKFWYEQVRCYCNKYLKMWKQLWNWVIGRDWKNFGVNVRNMNVKDDSGESAELKKKEQE